MPPRLNPVETKPNTLPNEPGGVTARSVGEFLQSADGFIVGTALKKDGIATNPVELARVKSLMRAIR